MLLVAGDIAGCTWSGDENTASVVNGLAGTVVTLGDNVYPNGTLSEFTSCYAPSWGQFKARTRPTPGNHDYNTPGATGYFDYFNGAGNQTGPAGDRSLGYYSFDVGTWHIVVLNSECETSTGLWLKGGCAAGSAQETWFKADLAAATTNNVIVTWHKPRYSSSTEHGNSSHMQALWKVAYDRGVDLVLVGALAQLRALRPDERERRRRRDLRHARDRRRHRRRLLPRLHHTRRHERGAQLGHARRAEADAARLELRVAVRPRGGEDVRRRGHAGRARAAAAPDPLRCPDGRARLSWSAMGAPRAPIPTAGSGLIALALLLPR